MDILPDVVDVGMEDVGAVIQPDEGKSREYVLFHGGCY